LSRHRPRPAGVAAPAAAARGRAGGGHLPRSPAHRPHLLRRPRGAPSRRAAAALARRGYGVGRRGGAAHPPRHRRGADVGPPGPARGAAPARPAGFLTGPDPHRIPPATARDARDTTGVTHVAAAGAVRWWAGGARGGAPCPPRSRRPSPGRTP